MVGVSADTYIASLGVSQWQGCEAAESPRHLRSKEPVIERLWGKGVASSLNTYTNQPAVGGTRKQGMSLDCLIFRGDF